MGYNTRMQKKLLAAAVVVVLVFVAWYFLSGTGGTGEAPAPAGSQPQGSGELTQPPRGAQVGGPVTWAIRPITEGSETDPPTTEVFAYTSAGRESMGVQSGVCTSIEDSPWDLLENEVSGVVCLWNGAGVEFGAFREGDGYAIKRGTVQEETGLRENFETISEI